MSQEHHYQESLYSGRSAITLEDGFAGISNKSSSEIICKRSGCVPSKEFNLRCNSARITTAIDKLSSVLARPVFDTSNFKQVVSHIPSFHLWVDTLFAKFQSSVTRRTLCNEQVFDIIAKKVPIISFASFYLFFAGPSVVLLGNPCWANRRAKLAKSTTSHILKWNCNYQPEFWAQIEKQIWSGSEGVRKQ